MKTNVPLYGDANIAYNLDLADGLFCDKDMQNARFLGCDLTGATFVQCNLANVVFADCLGMSSVEFFDCESFLPLQTHDQRGQDEYSVEYFPYMTKSPQRGWRVRSGCRDFSIQEALDHWSPGQYITDTPEEFWSERQIAVRLARAAEYRIAILYALSTLNISVVEQRVLASPNEVRYILAENA